MQTLSPMKIVVVPAWIQRSLIRNNVNTIDLLNYQKVRSVLSLDDLAEWFYMNDRLTVDDNLLSNCSLSHFWTNLAPDAQRELLNSVLPLSGSEEVAGSANHKLTVTKDFLGNPLSNQTYQFIRIEHVLFIVLSEGFITSVSDGSNLLDFIKNYLKECYAMTSVADVSKLGVFKSYLKHFSI